MSDNENTPREGGMGAEEYAEALRLAEAALARTFGYDEPDRKLARALLHADAQLAAALQAAYDAEEVGDELRREIAVEREKREADMREIERLVGAALSDEEMYEAVTDITRRALAAARAGLRTLRCCSMLLTDALLKSQPR